MNSPIEQEYIDALNRLVEKNAKISLNQVAIEAGKETGSLRKERLPFVCQEVERAIELLKPKKSKTKPAEVKAKAHLKEKYEELKDDYSIALQKIISLENQLFEVSKDLEHAKDPSAKKVESIKPRLK